MKIETRGLSQNQLKIIAAVLMLVDHIGAELLPQYKILRIIGRLSFPLFAYFVYEGCKYTHSKPIYLLRICLLGFLCMAVYLVYSGELFGNILITFSISICVIYSIQFFKEKLNRGEGEILGLTAAVLCVGAAYIICSALKIDYGFYGVMLPAFAEIFDGFSNRNKHMPLIGFGIGLLLMSVHLGGNQYFCLLALLLLAAYNGNRGKRKMKYFFYWFYPAQLAAIGAVSMLIE
ncbi:MAG: conjugal transfer protein TraX [Ruminococcus sp.]|nr:conjugal transfer protein TraX [Ruminococcus sp.]